MDMYGHYATPTSIYSGFMYAQHVHHPYQHYEFPQQVYAVKSPPAVATCTANSTRPAFSYVALIIMAIRAHPGEKATLKSIYNFIMSNFPYYRNKDTGWKNSIRHNLSLNGCFKKVERSVHDQSHGHFWGLSDDWEQMFAEGNYRRRRRGYKRPGGSRSPSPTNADDDVAVRKENELPVTPPASFASTPSSSEAGSLTTPPTSTSPKYRSTRTPRLVKSDFSDFSIDRLLGTPPSSETKSPLKPSSENLPVRLQERSDDDTAPAAKKRRMDADCQGHAIEGSRARCS